MKDQDLMYIQLVTSLAGIVVALMIGLMLGSALSNTHWMRICQAAHDNITQ